MRIATLKRGLLCLFIEMIPILVIFNGFYGFQYNGIESVSFTPGNCEIHGQYQSYMMLTKAMC